MHLYMRLTVLGERLQDPARVAHRNAVQHRRCAGDRMRVEGADHPQALQRTSHEGVSLDTEWSKSTVKPCKVGGFMWRQGVRQRAASKAKYAAGKDSKPQASGCSHVGIRHDDVLLLLHALPQKCSVWGPQNLTGCQTEVLKQQRAVLTLSVMLPRRTTAASAPMETLPAVTRFLKSANV